MGVAAGEAVDLVFNAGAIARPYSPDTTVEHGAAVKTLAQGVVYFFARVSDVAGHLVHQRRRIGVAEAAGIFIAGLFRPFMWEVRGPLMVGAIQNLFFLLLFSYSLFHAHRYRFTTLSWIAVGYIAALATFLPLVSPNLGSLERYKAAYLPFLLFILLIIPVKRFLSKE